MRNDARKKEIGSRQSERPQQKGGTSSRADLLPRVAAGCRWTRGSSGRRYDGSRRAAGEVVCEGKPGGSDWSLATDGSGREDGSGSSWEDVEERAAGRRAGRGDRGSASRMARAYAGGVVNCWDWRRSRRAGLASRTVARTRCLDARGRFARQTGGQAPRLGSGKHLSHPRPTWPPPPDAGPHRRLPRSPCPSPMSQSRSSSTRVSFAAVTPNNLGARPRLVDLLLSAHRSPRDRAEAQLRPLPHQVQRKVLQ